MFEQRWTVEAAHQGQRLDQFLPACSGLSRRKSRALIALGAVYINKQRCMVAGRALQTGQSIRLYQVENETIPAFTEEQILWQEKGLYLVHKLSGQYAQAALHRKAGTLASELAKQLKLPPIQSKELRPVHRLDRGTSGLMLLCTNSKTLLHLQQDWASKVEKEYLAVICGEPDWDEQDIHLPLGRKRDAHGRYHVEYPGRASHTYARVLERQQGRCLLSLQPSTGRTHQIRIHLAHLGHPILGDHRYGGRKHTRLMLHAHRLCVQSTAISHTQTWCTAPMKDWQW